MGLIFPPSASLWKCLNDQISSFKAKTIYIFLRSKATVSEDTSLSVYNNKFYISTCDNQLRTLVNYQAHPADIGD